MNKRYRILPIVLVAAGLATACSSGYDRDDAITEFVEGGLTTEQAVCVVDGLEDQIGEDRLGDRGSLTPEEEEVVTSLAFDCVLGEG